jgi:hypothetical protein
MICPTANTELAHNRIFGGGFFDAAGTFGLVFANDEWWSLLLSSSSRDRSNQLLCCVSKVDIGHDGHIKVSLGQTSTARSRAMPPDKKSD